MKLNIALVVLALISSNAMALDFDLPEQDTSLINMKTQFDLFFKKHGRYPRSWAELTFQYACGGWTSSNKFMPPRYKTKSWKPKYCKFTYVISDKNHAYSIELYDDSGKLDYVFEHNLLYKNLFHNNWFCDRRDGLSKNGRQNKSSGECDQ